MRQPSRRVNPLPIRAVKGWIKRVALHRGLLLRKLPGGRQGDAFLDQAALLQKHRVETIFDVGAYTGATALQYRHLFPTARIHCFEPVHDSYQCLSAAVRHDALTITNETALGDIDGRVDLHVNTSPFTSSILEPAAESGAYVDSEHFKEVARQSVPVTTIDTYCERHAIDKISILKLDVQGSELAALRGAAQLLGQGSILLIYSEILVAPMYEQQPPLAALWTLYEEYRYRLYGLYNFAYGADTRLFQMDAIFLSPRLKID